MQDLATNANFSQVSKRGLGNALEISQLPSGLKYLIKLGRWLVADRTRFPNNLRILITVPTEHLAALAISIGALNTDIECNSCDCTHILTSNEPTRASAYTDGKFQDGLAHLDSIGRVKFGQSTFDTTAKIDSRQSVHVLPKNFPQRLGLSKDKLKKEIQDFIETLNLGIQDPSQLRAIAGLERSRISAHPVIVLGHIKTFEQDLIRESLLSYLYPQGVCGIGKIEEEWFRCPCLVGKNIPSIENNTWLSEVLPRLVITVGKNACLCSRRDQWPQIPQVLILSRTSPSSVATVKDLMDLGWEESKPYTPEAIEMLKPSGGIEVSFWTESQPLATTFDLEENEDQW